MNKVKVYDIEKLVSKNNPECKAYDKNICIMIGESGIVTFDTEGIGHNFKSLDDEYYIYMTDIPEKNIVYTMPQYKAKTTIGEVLESAEFKEMYLQEYFSRYNYNSRLQNNYRMLLQAIGGIGIDFSEYIE